MIKVIVYLDSIQKASAEFENQNDIDQWISENWNDSKYEISISNDGITPEKKHENELLIKLSEDSFKLREKLLPDYKLLNAVLGIYSNDDLAKFKKTCMDFRTEFYRVKALIELAESKEDKENAYKQANFPKML